MKLSRLIKPLVLLSATAASTGGLAADPQVDLKTSAGTIRVELYPGYHAHRPPVPDDLAHQWKQAPDLYRALGWQVADTGELEADDLLGAYARLEEDAGGEALVLTGDRDMFQCATATTTGRSSTG